MLPGVCFLRKTFEGGLYIIQQTFQLFRMLSRLLVVSVAMISTPDAQRSIVFLGEPVTRDSNLVIAQLLHGKIQTRIFLSIDSPGGDVYANLGIPDTMNFIKPDVSTALASAASMGTVLLAAGARVSVLRS